ncbi:MAG: hypothetical protein MZV63_54425 [Marinilabiliales bacterium]|nr:hypothetical protein [Marinilabiliales bacterium]
MAELLGKEARIVYNKNNKPFIKDGSHFISITHSNKLTAILISRNERVGIDLEYMRVEYQCLCVKVPQQEGKDHAQVGRPYIPSVYTLVRQGGYVQDLRQGGNQHCTMTSPLSPLTCSESGEIKGYVKNERIR